MSEQAYIFRITAAYVVGAVVCLLLSESLVALAAGHEASLDVAPFVNAIFIAVTAPLLYAALHRTAEVPPRGADQLATGRIPVLLMALMGISVVAVMGLIYYSTSQSMLRAQQSRLSALAELQLHSFARQRQQQEGAALAIAARTSLHQAVEQWRAGERDFDRAGLRRQLDEAAARFGFAGIQLLDLDGEVIAGTMSPGTPQGLAPALARVMASRAVTFVPIYTNAKGEGFFGFLVPVISRDDGAGEIEAMLLTQTSVGAFLYPYLAEASRDSAGTEVFLMRPESDGSWLITTPLRDDPRPPLSVRVVRGQYDFAAPGSASEQPAVGIDHNGDKVIAVRQPVAGTPAVLIAKTRVRDVLQEARLFAAFSAALTGCALLLALAVGVALSERAKARGAMREVEQAKALQAAEARFRATFEQAAVGIAHMALDDTFLRVNKTLCGMLGYRRNELLHAPYALVRHPDDAANDAALQHDLRAGLIDNFRTENRHRRKDGSILWLSCTTSLARDATGAASYFILVAEDMSQRRAAHQALRVSEERFELAVRGADEGVWDWDFQTQRVYLSRRAGDLFALKDGSKAELLRLWTRRIHPDDRTRMWRARHELRHGCARSVEREFRVLMPDGGYRDFFARGLSATDEHGAIARAVGMTSDITERKEAERHLRLAAAVFDGSQEGLVITDLDGRVSAINPAFTRITGYAEAEMLGMNMRVLNSGRHDRAFYEQMWRAIRSEGSWQGEIWNRRKDGEVYLQRLTINTVCDAAGRPQSYVGACSDITQIKRSEFELDHMAHYDPLTDLPNRTLLASLLDHAINRPSARCAVLCVDLDRFKTVNESFGHLAGDEVLQMSATRMRHALGAGATLGRYGADEFVVILEGMEGPDEAATIATQVIAELAAPFVLDGGREVYVGASVGISLFPDDADSAQHLVQHADSALFEAKANGRGTYSFYTHALTRAATARIEMEADLRRALTRREFELHFQPFVELETLRLRGVEALVRWRSQRLGLVMPDSFIPLAEETGLIIALGDWVLEEACRRMAGWIAVGTPCAYIAVNLSPRQFNREDLAERIEAILARTGLPASRLEIEITESALFEKRAAAEEKLQKLAKLGVRIALDDFGTGYSSLGYLKRFPITKLKIDRSFVRDLPASVADGEITVAIISVAKALGLEVVAEGIETPVQLSFLRERGCDLGQGYLFSRPLPAEILERLPLMQDGIAPGGGA